MPNADIIASLDRPIPSPLSPVKGELEEGASEDVHLIHAKLSSSARQIFVSDKFRDVRVVASCAMPNQCCPHVNARQMTDAK